MVGVCRAAAPHLEACWTEGADFRVERNHGAEQVVRLSARPGLRCGAWSKVGLSELDVHTSHELEGSVYCLRTTNIPASRVHCLRETK